jgi:hypothetical protein
MSTSCPSKQPLIRHDGMVSVQQQLPQTSIQKRFEPKSTQNSKFSVPIFPKLPALPKRTRNPLVIINPATNKPIDLTVGTVITSQKTWNQTLATDKRDAPAKHTGKASSKVAEQTTKQETKILVPRENSKQNDELLSLTLDLLKNIDTLENKISSLEEARICSICMERAKDTAFQCGHTVCLTCASSLKYCHICRKKITKRIKIFEN